MISFFYNFLEKNKHQKKYFILRKFIKVFFYLSYPLIIKFRKSESNSIKIDDLIVSLTSFPSRINQVNIVIETLLRQTYQPHKIILWLAKEQFDSIDTLPKKLIKLTKNSLFEIKFCDDLRSHKKYYYTMKNYPKYYVITVDDDTLYPENLIEKLVLKSKKYPNTIICNNAHLITFDNNCSMRSYIEWKSGADGFVESSFLLVPIGAGGVLYPPNSLNKEVFNKKNIKSLCPLADDLWLKSMSILNNIKSIKVNPTSITFIDLPTSKLNSLNKLNVGENKNDIQFADIINKYPQIIETLECAFLEKRVI